MLASGSAVIRDRSLRMLFLADVPEDPNSGAAGTEVQTIAALRRLGHEVDAVWSDSLPHRIHHGNLHYLFELPRAYRSTMEQRLECVDYDVVQINQPHGFLAARAFAAAGWRGVFVHRSHGLEIRAEEELSQWRDRYEPDRRSKIRRTASAAVGRALRSHTTRLIRWADGHIVYSRACAEFLSARLDVPEERVCAVAPASPPSYRQSAALPMTTDRLRRILHVSQFAFFKAPMIVATALDFLAAQSSEVRFTWVCSKAHHEAVRSLVSPRTRSRLQLLDWLPQDELRAVYDAHGVFLFPSFFEGFGKVFLEAMSRGLCVIAAANSGAVDVIRDRIDGMLVPTGSANAMFEAAKRVISDPAEAASMSHRAASRAREYSWQRAAAETADFFCRLLAMKDPARKMQS